MSGGADLQAKKCILRSNGDKQEKKGADYERSSEALGTLSSGNADGDADAETGEKIGERTPL